MKYRKQYRQKRSRPFPTEYPKSPLQNGIPRTFLIKTTERPNCPLFAGGSQSGIGSIVHYEILKIEDEFGDIFTNFYAIRGDEITRVRNKKHTNPYKMKGVDTTIKLAGLHVSRDGLQMCGSMMEKATILNTRLTQDNVV